MISRRHIRLGIALLLPLMVLRGLLPAGYMTVANEGQLRIVMCSTGLTVPAGDDPAPGDHPADSGAGDCAFALAAGTLPPPTQQVLAIVEPVREIRFIASTAEHLPPATGPPRLAAARAPPALS